MSAEEDTELRDLIIQTLENNGVIGKIKAELRASVFLALEEEGSFRDKIPLINTKLLEFLSKPDGMLAVSLVREFLQFFNLNFTLAVFDPEIATSCDFLSKEEIRKKLKLENVENDSPVLSDLIRLDYKRETSTDNKRISEASILNAENKVNENESRSLRLGNSREPFSTDVSDKFSGMNYENQKSSKSSEASKDHKNDSVDPFFDEPLPSEKRPFFSVDKDDAPKDMLGTNLNSQSDFFGLKPEGKGMEKNSLSSLKDLPSLNPKNEISDWGLRDSGKKKLSMMDLDIHSGDGEYDDEDFHSSGSGQSAKSSQNSVNMAGQPKMDVNDNQDNSEQSIEEEIEEDLSGGVDDLLNSSLSLGDDVTTDQTISQVSLIGSSDYMEPCNPAK